MHIIYKTFTQYFTQKENIYDIFPRLYLNYDLLRLKVISGFDVMQDSGPRLLALVNSPRFSNAAYSRLSNTNPPMIKTQAVTFGTACMRCEYAGR